MVCTVRASTLLCKGAGLIDTSYHFSIVDEAGWSQEVLYSVVLVCACVVIYVFFFPLLSGEAHSRYILYLCPHDGLRPCVCQSHHPWHHSQYSAVPSIPPTSHGQWYDEGGERRGGEGEGEGEGGSRRENH